MDGCQLRYCEELVLREAVRTNPLDPPVIRAQLKERVETGAIVEGSGKESRRGTRKNEKNVKKAEESSNLPRSSFQAVFFFQKAARKLSFMFSPDHSLLSSRGSL